MLSPQWSSAVQDSFVVDLDRHPGAPDGVAAFKALRNGNELPPQPVTGTASNGFHLIFCQPAEGEPFTNSRGNLPIGCDVRGRGGWIVAAGASCEWGQWRSVKDNPKLADAYKANTIPELPQWLGEVIRPPRKEQHAQTATHGAAGKRERAYAEQALNNAADKVAASPRGNRNSELNTTAFCMGTMVGAGWIGQHTVAGRLFDAAGACGLVHDDGERAVRSTLKSGIESGLKQPHESLKDREQSWESSKESATFKNSEPMAWQRDAIRASELQGMTFAPVRYVLHGFIPEGLSILAGKPKIGKSWLMLDLSVAVAGNRFTLGTMKPAHGDALYLALEDNQRRLKRRMEKLLPMGSTPWPERLTLKTEWRRVDQGGLDDIEEWCASVPEPTFIAVDTLEKIRPLTNSKGQAYSADYQAIQGLQKIAGKFGIAIGVTHHLRKMEADDPFDTVSGTLGLSGAADTLLILKRQSGAFTLYVRGRDVEESETALQFNKDSCRWSVLGAAADVHRSAERAKIIAALAKAGSDGLSVPELMAAIESSNRHAIDTLLYKMKETGEIARVRRGVYSHRENPGVIGEKERNAPQTADATRACIQLSRIVTAANFTPARKFLASLS
jgi:AAA domain/Bifunctional DNA primase/polymerase, N-terminal